MTESFVQQSTSLLRTASLRTLSGYAEGMPEYELSVERLINKDGNSTLGYRVSLECAGTPLQHDLPKLPNNNDLIELASILGKKVPALYPMLTTDEARHLAHHVLIIADDVLTMNIGMTLLINPSKNSGVKCIQVQRDILDETPYIHAILIKNGERHQRLNSRQLKHYLWRNPDAIVFGTENDKRCLELAITNPGTHPTYITADNHDHEDYPLMTCAQRILYKFKQIKDDQLRFTKRGARINYNLNSATPNKTVALR